MPLYEYECDVCHRIFEEFRAYKDRHLVDCCGVRSIKRISQVRTNPDLSYKFVTNIFGGGPVQVRSGRHYRHLLKENNMPDASPLECKQQAAYRAKQRDREIKKKTRDVARTMAREIYNSNVNHVAGEAIGKILKGGVNNGQGQSNSSV